MSDTKQSRSRFLLYSADGGLSIVAHNGRGRRVRSRLAGAVRPRVSAGAPLEIDYKPVTRVENFCATG